jgi:ElaB/YqjD/DUF883 family membrane-anchored ribosome-binding protein
MSDTQLVTRDKLVADLRIVIADAEELLKATAGQAGDKIAAMRDRISRSLDGAKVRLSQLEVETLEKGKAAARATDHYVHENPWKSVGIAAGVGLLLGLLIGRR